ncbi:MAG: hypothetical protein KA520_12140 [Nitrosomonas sp.]|nr:hypothetical protein [Nitrosomonas sp.]
MARKWFGAASRPVKFVNFRNSRRAPPRDARPCPADETSANVLLPPDDAASRCPVPNT